MQRLMKEAKDLAVNPVENANAVPMEDNIMEWHANISTPLHEGVVFHFIIEFTDKYPKVAPKVKVCNGIDHPNVFGEYLCLDILTMSEETETTPYRGWTSAYTVRSLLVQLQCFLFDLPEEGRYSYGQSDAEYKRALSYECYKCGHCGEPNRWFPNIKIAERQPGFYRLRRLALVRQEAALDSAEICELKENTIVQVTKLEGRRARLNLVSHPVTSDYGYCSVYTKLGVLLKSVLSDMGPGVYKANVKVHVKKADSTILFKLRKHEQVTVVSLAARGGIVRAKLSAVPAKYCSDSLDLNEMYVDASYLRFVESISDEVENKVVLDRDSYWLHEFYGEVLDIILAMLDSDTVNAVSLCHEDLKSKVNSSQILQMQNYRCFYTLKSMREENVVIGVGIKTEVMDKRSRHKKMRVRNRVMDFKRPVLQRLHPSFDYMTFEAFDVHKVKTNVWKDCVFDSFLPLFINKTHGKKALPLAEQCITQMWKKENPRNSLTCERVLETLAKLMNTTIVNMNKCVDDVEVEEIQLFDSIKALEGYMAFHHLLLAFAMKYPKLVDIANQKIRDFCTTNEAVRDKEITPDVGELIVYLSISKYSWRQFFPAFAREVFDRNARWILAKYPGLRDVEGDNLRSCIRLTQSFLATQTGKRLAAFQCFFMNEIACPMELQGNDDKVKILFNEYNARLGKPVAGLAERLQVHSRKVLAMSNWFDYFTLVGFSAPSSVQLSDWLRQSISRSALKRYHNVSQILRFSESHIESPNYVLHKNHFNCMCAGGKVFNLQGASSLETCTLVSKPKERIDIAFVIDCTASMGSWISQVKKAIQQIVSDVNRKTQFKVVRFALVPYRDHSPGEGPNGYVVKKFDFTSNVQSMQKNVDTLSAGGGADAPEAMSCGFATAAGLSWNRDAMQLIIHIGDEKPHGISTDGYDYYPDGCPDGHDALRVAHNLAKKGIPIYNVYCGRHGSSLTETFYHALSHITGGQCLRLQNASTLSDIVLGAAMEEQTMNRISQKIAPIWERVHERHPHARDDQIIYELHQILKADNFKVKCVLGGSQLDKKAMKSIETIAFCMDIKQVKAMQEKSGEYFYSFSKGDGQITKESTKLIDEGQVRKWYKRNKEVMAIAKFKKEDCQYAQPQWQNEAAEERRKDRTLAKFGKRKPWDATDRRTVLKTFDEAGKLAHDGRNGTALIPSSGSVVKAPKVSAWTKPMTAKVEPSRNGPQPVQPRNVPARQHVQPRNVSARQPVQPRNVSARQLVQPRNVPAHQLVQPRNVPARQPVQPRNVPVPQPRNARAVNGRATGAALARPMSRNTSYPVNSIPNSRSSSRSSNPNFPGRGAPIQSIRTQSRSNSGSRRGAPIQSIRRSRSNSREPMRPHAAPVPVTSAAPQRTANAWTNSPSLPISRPPTSAACGCCAPTSRSSSGSSEKPFARSMVVKFDTNQIITDFLNSRFRTAGVSAPASVKVENGHAYVTFSSQQEANLASRSQLNRSDKQLHLQFGGEVQIQSVEQFRQTKI